MTNNKENKAHDDALEKEESNVSINDKNFEEESSQDDPKLIEDDHDAELIDNLNQQIEILQDKVLRTAAESENFRARMNKTLEETRDYSITNFAKDLIPVIDNLSRALGHLPEELNDQTKIIVEGVKMTKKELESAFKKHGLESLEPQVGDNFDYNQHHAISQLVTDKHKEGTIVNVMQVGYKIKDRLIRPASVVVAKK